jgi:hypothetical protein
MDDLPIEVILEIMSNLDNKSLMEASEVSKRYYRAAKDVAFSRYRKMFNRDPPTTKLLDVLRACGPLKQTSSLNRMINNTPFGEPPESYQVNKDADKVVFFGSGELNLIMNLRSRIHVNIDMTSYGGILLFSDFMSKIATAVYQRFVIPLSQGAQPMIPGMEASFMSGFPFVYASVTRERDGTYGVNISD